MASHQPFAGALDPKSRSEWGDRKAKQPLSLKCGGGGGEVRVSKRSTHLLVTAWEIDPALEQVVHACTVQNMRSAIRLENVWQRSEERRKRRSEEKKSHLNPDPLKCLQFRGLYTVFRARANKLEFPRHSFLHKFNSQRTSPPPPPPVKNSLFFFFLSTLTTPVKSACGVPDFSCVKKRPSIPPSKIKWTYVPENQSPLCVKPGWNPGDFPHFSLPGKLKKVRVCVCPVPSCVFVRFKRGTREKKHSVKDSTVFISL